MNEDWISQIKRGTLEYAVLLQIQKSDRYGYDLVQSMEDFPMLTTKESTVYPLLRRLLKSGYLDSYWKDNSDGIPPRKYYRLTSLGKEYLSKLDKDWKLLVNNIEDLRRSE
ncbi:MAG: PadR family transcriptional regulator [Clostridiaceae bacterium]|nr:PadR family transcriptional regulator [Clostridiaceae bacterium]